MRVAHFSTDDVRGGAAKTAYDLHRALRQNGVHSRLYVRFKHTVDDDDVVEVPVSRWAMRINRFDSLLRYKSWQAVTGRSFDANNNPCIDVTWLKNESRWNADVVAVHWVSGLLNARLIRYIYDHWRLPVVWTMMDQSPVTGGCHYTWGCKGYQKSCGNCPQLVASNPRDRSYQVLQQKKKLLSQLPLAFWCGSNTSVEMVKHSSVFSDQRVISVSAPINGEVFRPIDKACARHVLGVSQDNTIILCGANMVNDERKGGKFMVAAFNLLKTRLQKLEPSLADRIEVLVVGWYGHIMISQIPFKTAALGYLHDERMLALAYQASDIFVSSSVEDEGPVMIPQAMMCETPVVAFPTGTGRELVRTGMSGFLCEQIDASCLADGILYVLKAERIGSMGAVASRMASSRHDSRIVAREYVNCIEEFCRSCRR